MSGLDVVNPTALGFPSGYAHGIMAPAGWRMLFVAGQTGTSGGRSFVAEFDAALARVLAVVEAAGGGAEHVVRMNVYVTDLDGYLASRPALGQLWRQRMGTHYPAMSLVEVSRLVDANATVEIEAMAMLPPSASAA